MCKKCIRGNAGEGEREGAAEGKGSMQTSIDLTPVKETEKDSNLERKSLRHQHGPKDCSARSAGNLAPKLSIRGVPHPRNGLALTNALTMLNHWLGALTGRVAWDPMW